MRFKIFILFLLCACSMCAQVSEGIAKNKIYQGFSGGMMLHTGYLFGQDKMHPSPQTDVLPAHKEHYLVLEVLYGFIYGNICVLDLKDLYLLCQALLQIVAIY